MEAETRCEYYAFISYSHKDKKWAEWLQHKLEHYKIPTSLHKESDGALPKKVKPVFWDKTDLGVGSLEFNLRNELKDSRYLIVVCSPDSAKSDWVNKEIAHFKEMGREDRMIPVIISGEPGSGSVDEYYPPGLQEMDAPGIRLFEKNEKEVLIQIVARLLELDFNTLWEREIKEQKSRQRRTAAIGGALAAVIGIASWAYWDFNFNEKVAYFSNYVEIYGVANGVDPLTSEQVLKRNLSYKITRLKGKVISLEKVNGSGYLCTNSVSLDAYIPRIGVPAKIEYFYDENENLDKAMYLRKNGSLILTLDYTQNNVATLYSTSKTVSGGVSIGDLSEKTDEFYYDDYAANNEINQFKFEYDDQGKTIKRFFRDVFGSPKENENGVFLEAYQYDTDNRLIAIDYFDEMGTSTTDKYGIHSIQIDRNGKNEREITKISYFDLGGLERVNKNQFSSIEFSYDPYGNILKKVVLINGKPVNPYRSTVSAVKYEYDEKGNIKSESFLNKHDEPTKSGSASTTIMEYDLKGNIVKESYYDKEGKFVKGDNTVAICEKNYDINDNLINEIFYDADGEQSDYYINYIYDYKKAGYTVRKEYRDLQNKLILYDNKKYAAEERAFDKRGNILKESYFGADGKYTINYDGYASKEFS